MRYEDVQSGTPHLAVRWRVNDRGEEQFEWGGSGSIPPMSIVGAITRAQHGLLSAGWTAGLHWCPVEDMLIIAWDASTRTTEWFCDSKVNVEAMVGMLETVKGLLLTGVGRRAAAQQVPILGPDGQPMVR